MSSDGTTPPRWRCAACGKMEARRPECPDEPCQLCGATDWRGGASPDGTAVCCPQPIAGVCPACGEMDGGGYCGAIGTEIGRTVIHIRDQPRSPWE